MARYKVVTDQGTFIVTTEDAAPPPSDNYADPTALIKQAAPSRILGAAGAASVNAPDVFSGLASMMPGGNPQEMMQSARGLMRNPGQVAAGAERFGAVLNNAAPTDAEMAPFAMGTAAGAITEMAAMPGVGKMGPKAGNAFSAGFKDPSTALPGALGRAQKAVGVAKEAARVEGTAKAERFRRLLNKKEGSSKLAEEGMKYIDEGLGDAMNATELLAYKEALGKTQALGGTFAGDYAGAVAKINQIIAQRFPELSEAISKTAMNYVARGAKPESVPWLTLAIDPKVGLAKLISGPTAARAAGAVTGLGFRAGAKSAPSINSSLGFGRR
jgi:hypothetical protein